METLFVDSTTQEGLKSIFLHPLPYIRTSLLLLFTGGFPVLRQMTYSNNICYGGRETRPNEIGITCPKEKRNITINSQLR